MVEEIGTIFLDNSFERVLVSPDGRALAASTMSYTVVARASGEVASYPGCPWLIGFTGDSRLLVLAQARPGSSGSVVVAVDTEALSVAWECELGYDLGMLEAASLSPDGYRLTVLSPDGEEVFTWQRWLVRAVGPESMAWSPDGSILAVGLTLFQFSPTIPTPL